MSELADQIKDALPFLAEDLIREISEGCQIIKLAPESEIIRQGQYVKVVPIVLDGLVKVYTSYEDKDLLLYYIRPNESCIMSFNAGLKNEPSQVFARSEEDTQALLLPIDRIKEWTIKYPDINRLFFEQYNQRYSELLETIHHVLFDRMDKRLFDYLKQKSALTKKNPLRISHREIAQELGTAREVITRVMKKLETEGKVIQYTGKIKVVAGD